MAPCHRVQRVGHLHLGIVEPWQIHRAHFLDECTAVHLLGYDVRDFLTAHVQHLFRGAHRRQFFAGQTAVPFVALLLQREVQPSTNPSWIVARDVKLLSYLVSTSETEAVNLRQAVRVFKQLHGSVFAEVVLNHAPLPTANLQRTPELCLGLASFVLLSLHLFHLWAEAFYHRIVQSLCPAFADAIDAVCQVFGVVNNRLDGMSAIHLCNLRGQRHANALHLALHDVRRHSVHRVRTNLQRVLPLSLRGHNSYGFT